MCWDRGVTQGFGGVDIWFVSRLDDRASREGAGKATLYDSVPESCTTMCGMFDLQNTAPGGGTDKLQVLPNVPQIALFHSFLMFKPRLPSINVIESVSESGSQQKHCRLYPGNSLMVQTYHGVNDRHTSDQCIFHLEIHELQNLGHPRLYIYNITYSHIIKLWYKNIFYTSTRPS